MEIKQYVTVDSCKQHCRIEIDEDDNYVSELIDIAQAEIASYLGAPLSDYEDDNGQVDIRIYHAIRIEVDNLYENRGTMAFANVSDLPYLENLLTPLRKIRCRQDN